MFLDSPENLIHSPFSTQHGPQGHAQGEAESVFSQFSQLFGQYQECVSAIRKGYERFTRIVNGDDESMDLASAIDAILASWNGRFGDLDMYAIELNVLVQQAVETSAPVGAPSQNKRLGFTSIEDFGNDAGRSRPDLSAFEVKARLIPKCEIIRRETAARAHEQD